MDKHVLYSYFHAIDMDDVDGVFGNPWMDSVCIVNINVRKNILELWYRKRKITLYDISLTKQEGPKGAHEELFVGIIVLIPTNTSNEESEIEL